MLADDARSRGTREHGSIVLDTSYCAVPVVSRMETVLAVG